MKQVIFDIFPIAMHNGSIAPKKIRLIYRTKLLDSNCKVKADSIIENIIQNAMDLSNVFTNSNWKVISVTESQKQYDKGIELYVGSDVERKKINAKNKQTLAKKTKLFTDAIITKKDVTVATDNKSFNIQVGKKTFNLDISRIYAILQLNKMINATIPFDEDASMQIFSNNNNKIIEWVGHSNYSMVANAINIYDNEKLDGRTASIMDMPEAGFIITHENNNAVILLTDRKRQMMLKIYVKELMLQSFNQNLIEDKKVTFFDTIKPDQLKLN